MNILSSVQQSTRDFLDKEVDCATGIASIRSWRFWASLLALIVATCVLANDPLFFDSTSGFQYQSGVLCIVVSYLVLSALFWELLLFGRPRGVNLFLQVAALVPFSLFVARTFTKPVAPAGEMKQTLVSVAWKCVKTVEGEFLGFSDILNRFVPDWVVDVFSHWSVAVTLLIVIIALCFRQRSCKVGLLFATFLVGVASAVSVAATWQFIVGALILVVALVLMYNPYDERLYYYGWISELSREPVNSVELDVISKVMSEMYRRGRLSYEEVGELILSRMPGGVCDEEALRSASRKLVDRLLRRYDFAVLVGDATGTFLQAAPRLMAYDSLVLSLAIYPRRLIVALVGLAWLISPLDIVPDAIPVFGVLDDAAIAILSMKSIAASRPCRRE